jgi:protein tyrosine/serine phosphatase
VSARAERHLAWEGAFNVRDLGGLRTLDGGRTRWGAIVRADSLAPLTEAGWSAALEHGVRTVIDLRNDEEIKGDLAARPPSVTTIHLPLDGSEDHEFWEGAWASGPQFGTPFYYRPHLDRFPERSAGVIAAIARAAPGAVAFHCGEGRDRAGQVAMLVLAIVGVRPEEIAADYALSAERLRARYAARGEEDQGPELQEFLAARGATAGELILATLGDLDVERTVLGAGATHADLEGLRRRLLASEANICSGS